VAELVRIPKRRRRSRLPWFARYVAVLVVAGALLAASATVGLRSMGELSGAVSTGPDAPVVLSPLSVRSYIYDREGNEIALLYADEDREAIKLEQVPAEVQASVLVVEDKDFYAHGGFNVRSTFRALFSNLEAGDIEQGGSTITQQLIKNSIVGNEQTFGRKAREAVLAVQLEDQMSKDDILERYLNTVYLGNGAYGVQAFAETYFNSTAGDLGWSEAALLTALIRNPVGYDPIRYPTLARQRRDLVATELLAAGKISQSESDVIDAEPLPTQLFSRARTTESAQLAGANYFSEEVKQQLLDLPELGATEQARYDSVFKGGLRVRTTYDPAAQGLAENAVATLPDKSGKFTAALASVDPATGAVRAVVGGTDFNETKFNNATQGWRQPGSSFKFFTLMAAFESGDVPDDSISGASPCRFPDPGSPKGVYVAKNSGRGGSTRSITSQTTSSSNCAFLRLAQSVGLDKVAAVANAMGITTLNPKVDDNGRSIIRQDDSYDPVEGPVPSDVLSMPIGSKEVHPLNMAAAFATAANGGVYHEPYFIESVSKPDGTIIYQHSDAGRQVVSSQTARLVTQVLVKNVTSGTGKRARLDDQEAAGKTGTTQENADVWFVGYTPYLSTAVWIGSPTDRAKVTLGGRTQFGADYPARIWNAFMEPAHRDLPPKDFPEATKTRRGTSIRYTNKVDKGGRARCVPRPAKPCPTRKTTTTVTPGASPPPPSPPSVVPPEPPPATTPPVTTPPTQRESG